VFIDVPKPTLRTTSRLGAVLGRYCDAPDAEVSPYSTELSIRVWCGGGVEECWGADLEHADQIYV